MIIPKNSVKRLIKKAGAKRVSDEAVEKLTDILEAKGIEICKKAQELAKLAKRKTVLKKDIKEAIRMSKV